MKPTRHIVVDIETMDTQPSAVIMSAGLIAVEISHSSVTVLSRWYRRIRWIGYDGIIQQPGRTVSLDTLNWWKKQDFEVFHEACAKGQETRLPLALAMHSLAAWLDLNPYPIWGNGSDFDNRILQDAFQQQRLRWPYWRNCCLRSTKNLVKQLVPDVQLPDFPDHLTPHVAIDDAEHEAHILAALLRALQPTYILIDLEPQSPRMSWAITHLKTVMQSMRESHQNSGEECGMSQYQAYTCHHITPRTTPPADECETMRLPRAECGCPGCCESRYPADLVESDGGEV